MQRHNYIETARFARAADAGMSHSVWPEHVLQNLGLRGIWLTAMGSVCRGGAPREPEILSTPVDREHACVDLGMRI
jgi:hypothetical protein